MDSRIKKLGDIAKNLISALNMDNVVNLPTERLQSILEETRAMMDKAVISAGGDETEMGLGLSLLFKTIELDRPVMFELGKRAGVREFVDHTDALTRLVAAGKITPFEAATAQSAKLAEWRAYTAK